MWPGHSSGRRIGPLLVTAIALACAVPPGMAVAASSPAAEAVGTVAGRYVAGEAVVRFERGVSAAERQRARRATDVTFDDALAMPRAEVVEVEGAVAAAVRRLERQPGVAYAQPNYRYRALAVPAPDDTFFAQLWGLSDPSLPDAGVSALEAWEESEGQGQAIAIVDTGVDLTHPDIAPNLWTNPAEAVLPGDGLDNDLNGQVDDLHGYDFVDGDGDPDDYEFHGTHVAGTAAAVAGNSQGVAGVAPLAEIMAVRVLDGDGSGSTADIADGIAYAAENGATAINLSLGGPAGEDQLMSDAVDLAAAKDAVVVAAAGNEGADNDVEPHTPCTLPQPNLICVAALNQAGGLAGFSSFGAASVDVAAPGTSVLSAKVDYGASLFADGFESSFAATWDTVAFNGGIPWGPSATAASGTQSAADSPSGPYGQAVDPTEFAVSELFTDDPVDLSGERGCRVHFRAMYETEEEFDFFVAGAADEATDLDFAVFEGTSSGYPTTFSREEASISDLAGRSDVHPLFAMLSDELIELDGAYVDDVRLICRDETYVDAIASGAEYDLANAGSYVRFNGTSMATPHVAGVVALVRAAVPGLSALEAVDAVLAGASAIPVPDSSRRTRTEGIADACQAIAIAAGSSEPLAGCPGSSENVVPAPPGSSSQLGTATEGAPSAAFDSVADRRRPRTFFRRRPPHLVRTRGARARVVFRFGSDEAGVSFVCRVDGHPFRRCQTRFVRGFRLGSHVLRVVARDAAGNVDRTPAVFRFAVRRRG